MLMARVRMVQSHTELWAGDFHTAPAISTVGGAIPMSLNIKSEEAPAHP
jgi:hypothetical protein